MTPAQRTGETNGQAERDDERLQSQLREIRKRVRIAFEARRSELNAADRWDHMHMFWNTTPRGHVQAPPNLDILSQTQFWDRSILWDEQTECISREWFDEIRALIRERTTETTMTQECYQQLQFLSRIPSSRSDRMKTICDELEETFFSD